MSTLKYLSSYQVALQEQIQALLDEGRLTDYLLTKYPQSGKVNTDKQLRDYVLSIKNTFLKKSAPLSKIAFDPKIHVVNHALGLHTYVSRIQGGKLKAKNELRVSTLFKNVPDAFLRMIVVHELAHLKEKDHNKSFYQLCTHMLPEYHQLEFDMRVYLTHIESVGEIY
ncbi:M48 family metallopeptidase [Alteromonas sp. A079]|uniref:M48 metallopeptidase family protein n=1 Tax=Alteromonas sp. A079 TaxID=3410268 RepID=UPI003BA329C5